MMIRETRPKPLDAQAASIKDFDSTDAMSPEDALDALQDVVDDVDEYVLEWFKRLHDGLVSEGPSTTSDRELRARIKEFREEKRQWEAKRDVERQELQEKMRQLTDAWLRLEEEQRQLLQRREASVGAARDKATHRDSNRRAESATQAAKGHIEDTSALSSRPSPPLASSRAPSASTAPIATTASPPAQPRSISHDREQARPASARASQPDDAAVRQFQQLRREIESSRPRPGLG